MDNENKGFIISREMYKKIKGMNRKQLQVFATTIYLNGVKTLKRQLLTLTSFVRR